MSVASRICRLIPILPSLAVACFALTASAADEDFTALTKRLQAEKTEFSKRQQDLLAARYDLSDRPSTTTMSRGKPLQESVRVRLPAGMTWDKLELLSPEEIREKQLWPAG